MIQHEQVEIINDHDHDQEKRFESKIKLDFPGQVLIFGSNCNAEVESCFRGRNSILRSNFKFEVKFQL